MILWGGFIVGIVLLVWLDYTFDKGRKLTTKLLTLRVLFWIGLALCFNVFVFFKFGQLKALEFLTGYIVEESLSVDNLFVFIMLFAYFSANSHQQMKALQWGIYGAMILRLAFILFGITLIHHFHPVIYIFGVILLWSAWKMQFSRHSAKQPNELKLIKAFKKIMPITDEYHGDRFFLRIDGKLWATPMVALVIAVESSDVMFALDSIPAILAITTDPFIVFTSNIFAILGLRSIFFLLAHLMKLFIYLKSGVALILAFVAVKMLLLDIIHIPILASLGFIASTLIGAIVFSIIARANSGLRKSASDNQ